VAQVHNGDLPVDQRDQESSCSQTSPTSVIVGRVITPRSVAAVANTFFIQSGNITLLSQVHEAPTSSQPYFSHVQPHSTRPRSVAQVHNDNQSVENFDQGSLCSHSSSNCMIERRSSRPRSVTGVCVSQSKYADPPVQGDHLPSNGRSSATPVLQLQINKYCDNSNYDPTS